MFHVQLKRICIHESFKPIYISLLKPITSFGGSELFEYYPVLYKIFLFFKFLLNWPFPNCNNCFLFLLSSSMNKSFQSCLHGFIHMLCPFTAFGLLWLPIGPCPKRVILQEDLSLMGYTQGLDFIAERGTCAS